MINFGRTILSIAAILLVLFWVVVINAVFTVRLSDAQVLGIVVFILGAILSFRHRSIGKSFYTKVITSRLPGSDSFWFRLGEQYTQRFYLVVGLITAIAGSIIILGSLLTQ